MAVKGFVRKSSIAVCQFFHSLRLCFHGSCNFGIFLKLTTELISARKTSHEHNNKDVPLVRFMYLVFTRMPGESNYKQLRSLLCLCDVFRALVNSLVS